MNITINEKLVDFITEQASNDAVTVEVWCERKLNANVKQIRREKLFETIKSDIATYEPVVLAKKIEVDEIKRVAAEEAKAIEEAAAIGAETTATRTIQE